MNTKTYYQNDRYAKANLEWRAKEFFPVKFRRVIERTNIKLKGKILDVGYGDGGLAREIINRFRKVEVFGVDVSRKGVKLAKKHCVDAKVCDLNKKIPYKDSSFDCIVCFEVIEHLVNVDTLVKEIRRVLKNNGIGVITTPNLLSWYQRILCLFGIIPTFMELSNEDRTVGLGFIKKITKNKQTVGHIRVFNRSGIEDILKLHGLKIVKVKSIPIDFPLPKPLNILFNSIDTIMSGFPSLGSDLIVVFKK